ncbi:hypothetical protein C2S52_010645 [Perilla frutescens var. hirtella]|nr:hypothetical protein C2S52_010645 [Perilla frutescens var. hirtella]KAH6817474.1 hypothetical protein C2S51_001077 [Perilla frutescens var. frutescens]
MIGIYSKLSLFSEAERLYIELKTSDVKLDMMAFSIVMRMYVKSGSLKKACMVVDMMDEQKNIVPDVYLLRDILCIYQRCGRDDKLTYLYYRVLKNDESWDEEMYNCVINCCARVLPVDEFSRLFDEMLRKGLAPNTIIFNVMLNAYGKSKLFERARKAFWIAKKRELKECGNGPDLCSYNTLIKAYGVAEMVEEGVGLVKEMRVNGIEPDRITYSNMITVLKKNDMFLEAVKWSLWMKQMGL